MSNQKTKNPAFAGLEILEKNKTMTNQGLPRMGLRIATRLKRLLMSLVYYRLWIKIVKDSKNRIKPAFAKSFGKQVGRTGLISQYRKTNEANNILIFCGKIGSMTILIDAELNRKRRIQNPNIFTPPKRCKIEVFRNGKNRAPAKIEIEKINQRHYLEG